MIGSPPAPTGQLSPDGRWRWDGTRWLPVQPQRKSHRRVWLWTAAGCSTAILLTAAGGGYWVYTLWQGVKSGTTSCVPSSFPRYPGSKLGPWSYDYGSNGPNGSCQATFESSDDLATVSSFYKAKLNSGPWEVTVSDDQTNTVIFEAAGGTAPYGTLQLAPKDGGTEIALNLISGACRLWQFPTYPKAKFGGQSVGTGGYGCHVVYLTTDSASAVIAFYKSKLSQGNWQVVSSNSTQVSFRLVEPYKNRYMTRATGTVTVGTSFDERTQITVDSFP